MTEPPKRPGPPPLPKTKSSEVELSVEDSMPLAPPVIKSGVDRIIEPLPMALTVLLIGVGVTVLAGLIFPATVMITVPILTMIGIWIASFGYRIQWAMPKGMLGLGYVKNLFSPLGQYASWVTAIGLGPLMLLMIGLPILSSARGDENVATRFLLVFFAIVMIPAVLLILAQTKRRANKANGDGR